MLEGVVNHQTLDGIIQKAEEQAMRFEAIPLEQLKGDIARSGHPVKQALALDAEGHRLFFTDVNDEYLFAEFGSASEGYRVKRIGHQSSIAKEYDPVDLEPSGEGRNRSERVTTGHEEGGLEEDDAAEAAGVYPGGTPGDKPMGDDRGYGVDDREPARKALIREVEKFCK